MAFDPENVAARLALKLIPTLEMPRLAWDALEAGLDGPAIRRLASFEFPTFFQVQEVLPQAVKEMRLTEFGPTEAALKLASRRANEILLSGSDPTKNLRDFEHLWIQSGYRRELQEYGTLDDEVIVARSMGQTESEIRIWLIERLKTLTENR